MDAKSISTLLLLLLAGCTFSEEAATPREPRPDDRPTSEPPPAPAPEPVPEVIPRDACLGCGMGFVPEVGKAFLDAYSATKA